MSRSTFSRRTGGTRSRRCLAIAPLAIAVLSAACSPGSPADEVATEGVVTQPGHAEGTVSLSPGEPVPAPTGEPVLRLFGRIATTNGSAGLTLDVATIERLGLVSLELYEPFQKQRMRFQGVPFAKVLDLAGIDAATRQVHLTALDDYTHDFSVDQARRGGLILATRSGDGSSIPVENGGPTRLVFADGTPGAGDINAWVWSMATVEVR